jgi:hypothetical protein
VLIHFAEDLIRIEVVDQGGDVEPQVRSVTRHVEEDGRGLMMIAACAKDWGVKDRPSGARCVWVELVRNGS